MLQNKSLTELRGIAQSFGITDIFRKDRPHLIQDIEQKQKALAPMPTIDVPLPAYDARLMTKPPSRLCNRAELESILAPYVALGLEVTYEAELWKMRFGKKTDQGTMRMPLRIAIKCAQKLMK